MVTPHDITVVIPTHPARSNGLLQRALTSVLAQTWRPAGFVVAMDNLREGAPATRQRALDSVNTPWVAFLDSDDAFDPDHLESLGECANRTGADYVFSYWHTAPDVLGHFGKVFDPQHPTETTITVLVRTELAKKVGFKALPDRFENTGEDFRLVLGCLDLGAKVVHLPKRTWLWAHHGGNTSGMPTKGDAVLDPDLISDRA